MYTAFTQKQVWTLSSTLGASLECSEYSQADSYFSRLLQQYYFPFFLYTLFLMFHSLDFCFACRTSTSRFTSVFCVLSVIHAASVYSSILNLNLDTDVQYLQILIESKTIKSIRNIHAHISSVSAQTTSVPLCTFQYWIFQDRCKSNICALSAITQHGFMG